MGQTLADAILSTAADAILLADPDNIIRFWNPGATRIFGFSPEEAVGQPLDIIIPENLRARHNEGYAQTMTTGVTRYGSGDILAVPALTKDGRRISVEFTIVLLHGDDGKVSGIAAILRDVTERFQELRTLRRRIAELSAAGSKALSG
jgi:PAS domain S-box-containing protein